jgi:gas vesicle protein
VPDPASVFTDPALTGLIGTAIGGIIGFAGTVLTSWQANKREERSRLFTERRQLYARAMRIFNATVDKLPSITIATDPDELRAAVTGIGEAYALEHRDIEEEINLIGSPHVVQALFGFELQFQGLKIAALEFQVTDLGREGGDVEEYLREKGADQELDEQTATVLKLMRKRLTPKTFETSRAEMVSCLENIQQACASLGAAMRDDLRIPGHVP